MLNSHNFEEIYSGMIAGSMPNHDGDVQLSLFYVARDILGTENIHLLTSISDDGLFIYYFAQKSSCFASVSEFQIPLAAAFPTHPQHQGDGVYLLSHGAVSVALIKSGEKFKLVTNSTVAIDSLVEDLELPIYPSESFSPVVMQSISGSQRQLADKFSGAVIKWSSIFSGVALLVGLISHLSAGVFASSLQSSNDKSSSELSALVSKIEHASPLSQQLAGMQRISATVVRAGGWIDSYEMKNGKEKFAVSLPEWVTPDFIAALGKDAEAERDIAHNIIKVQKLK